MSASAFLQCALCAFFNLLGGLREMGGELWQVGEAFDWVPLFVCRQHSDVDIYISVQSEITAPSR